MNQGNSRYPKTFTRTSSVFVLSLFRMDRCKHSPAAVCFVSANFLAFSSPDLEEVAHELC